MSLTHGPEGRPFAGGVALVTGMGRPDGLAASIVPGIPLGRLRGAGEMAGALGGLLSGSAAGVTGEALNVSAGQTMV